MNELGSWVAAGALALGFAGCASMQVRTSANPEANLGSLATYAWMDRPQRDVRMRGSMVEQRLFIAVDRELAAKGYRKVETDPDFLVGYHAALEEALEVATTYEAYGRRRRPLWVEETEITEYTRGTLILDIAGPDGRELLWRGSAEGAIDDPGPSRLRDEVDQAATAILERFPPAGG